MSKKIKHGFTIIALFCTVFIMGRGAGYLQETAAAVSYSENWGLGFGASGTQPTGNASAKELAEYDAFYIGNADEKTIYLRYNRSSFISRRWCYHISFLPTRLSCCHYRIEP